MIKLGKERENISKDNQILEELSKMFIKDEEIDFISKLYKILNINLN